MAILWQFYDQQEKPYRPFKYWFFTKRQKPHDKASIKFEGTLENSLQYSFNIGISLMTFAFMNVVILVVLLT